jgi:hypothetical protein
MKKLLLILCFLPTIAMAIDRPIPCTGNSCKLLFETTGSGGAKVSAGNVDGTGVWTIGPSGSVEHILKGSLNRTLGSSVSSGVSFDKFSGSGLLLTNGSSQVFTTSGKATLVLVSNTTNNDHALFITGGTSTALISSSGGSWSATDAGTATRFFKTASTTHELKNETGSSVTYRVHFIVMDQ